MTTAKDHASEVLSKIRQSRVTVYDGLVDDNPTLPYVVVYFDAGFAEPTTVNAQGRYWRTYNFQTTYVAEDAAQLRWLVDKVEAELLGADLDVYRTATTPVEKRASQQGRPDFDTRPPRFYAVDQWSYSATA